MKVCVLRGGGGLVRRKEEDEEKEGVFCEEQVVHAYVAS
jgi:hypothetical protein